VPAADLAGRPDLIERNFTADAPVPETGGRPSPICFSPGKDSCTRQAVTGLPARKELLATPWQGHMRTDLPPKRSAKLAVRNCQPIEGVTIFHVESRDRSTRPLTTPPPWTSMASIASVGRTGVCYVQRSSRYHSTPPAQERTRQPAGSTTPEEKQSKRWHHGLNSVTIRPGFNSALGYRTPNEVHQDWGKTKTAA